MREIVSIHVGNAGNKVGERVSEIILAFVFSFRISVSVLGNDF